MNLLGLARHGLNSFEQIAIICVLFTAFISLWYAWMLRKTVLKKDKGTDKMQEVWNAIRVGADSYLSRQLKKILPLIGVLTVALFLSVYIVPASAEAVREFGPRLQGPAAQLLVGGDDDAGRARLVDGDGRDLLVRAGDGGHLRD